MNPHDLDALVGFFENLQPENLGDFSRYYAQDARFKDPFNEVQGLERIERIFAHMFEQVAEPRFVVHERVADTHGVALIWTMSYRMRARGSRLGELQSIRGASHLKFNDGGRVIWHRDYWDAAEELYAKLPLLGWLMRFLKSKLAS